MSGELVNEIRQELAEDSTRATCGFICGGLVASWFTSALVYSANRISETEGLQLIAGGSIFILLLATSIYAAYVYGIPKVVLWVVGVEESDAA